MTFLPVKTLIVPLLCRTLSSSCSCDDFRLPSTRVVICLPSSSLLPSFSPCICLSSSIFLVIVHPYIVIWLPWRHRHNFICHRLPSLLPSPCLPAAVLCVPVAVLFLGSPTLVFLFLSTTRDRRRHAFWEKNNQNGQPSITVKKWMAQICPLDPTAAKVQSMVPLQFLKIFLNNTRKYHHIVRGI